MACWSRLGRNQHHVVVSCPRLTAIHASTACLPTAHSEYNVQYGCTSYLTGLTATAPLSQDR